MSVRSSLNPDEVDKGVDRFKFIRRACALKAPGLWQTETWNRIWETETDQCDQCDQPRVCSNRTWDSMPIFIIVTTLITLTTLMPTQVCNNGTWSSVPKCIPAKCTELPDAPRNGMVGRDYIISNRFFWASHNLPPPLYSTLSLFHLWWLEVTKRIP